MSLTDLVTLKLLDSRFFMLEIRLLLETGSGCQGFWALVLA